MAPRSKKGASGPELERSRRQVIDSTLQLVSQIRAALTDTLTRIPDMDSVEEGATVWLAAQQIAADLTTIKRDVASRIVQLSPTRVISPGKPTEREAPVKEQVLDGIGIVTIVNEKERTWGNKRELAHNIVETWPQFHEAQALRPHEVVDMIFDIFAVGDPRVTALREAGIGEHYEQEPWLAERWKDGVSVSVKS